MKKTLIAVLILLVVAGSFHVLSDYYREDFYGWAINFEQKQAQLTSGKLALKAEQIAYLEGPKHNNDAEHVLLLHGFGASKENWLRFAGYLTDQFHVVVPDLAGHGENVRDMNRSYSTEAQVEFVKAFAESMGMKRFHVVGNSMGGAIAALFAANYPEKIASVTLISPAGIHDIPSLMEERLEAGDNPLIATTVEEFESLMDFVMESPPFIPHAVAKVEAEKAISRIEINRKIFADLRDDLEKGMEQRLKQIKAPVLILWGDHDRAIHVGNIDKYAALIPNADTHIFEGIGHLAMIEIPERSAYLTRQFIARGAVPAEVHSP